MTAAADCPRPEVLHRLLEQGGATETVEALATHLERCPACGERFEALLRRDALLPLLRAPARTAIVPPEVLERLRSLRPAAEVARRTEQTVALAPAAPVAPGERTEPALDFLGAPRQPDELARLGPYRILDKIGGGGMGLVLLAEDTLLRRKVALKVMLPALAANPLARDRFLREARLAAAIEHPHIVPVYQVGEDAGVPFLAMPLLKGESLEDRLQRERRLPVGEALRIGAEIAEGLQAAHAAGLIHRDVKPSNIWLEGAGATARLLDFGLARSQTDDARLTHPGTIIGTPAYMAPEQARGEPIAPRADLWSLGAVLYRMLTGERPFKGENTLSALTSLAMDSPPPPQRLNPDVAVAVGALVMQLLRKDPAARPASAARVAAELRRLEGARTPPPRRAVLLPVLIAVRLLLSAVGALMILVNRPDRITPTVAVPDAGLVQGDTQGSLPVSSPSETSVQGAAIPARMPNDRAVADWLRRIGARVWVRRPDGARQWLRSMDPLPADGWHFSSIGLMIAVTESLPESEILDHLERISKADEIFIEFPFSAGGLRRLLALPALAQAEVLDLRGSPHFDEDCFRLLKGYHRLHTLCPSNGSAAPAALENLRRLPLRKLNLTSSRVADAALVVIGTFPALEDLDLSVNFLTDAGLEHLAALKTLKRLNVRRNGVSRAAVRALAAALPACRIEWDGGIEGAELSPRGTPAAATPGGNAEPGGLRLGPRGRIEIPLQLPARTPVSLEVEMTPEPGSAATANHHLWMTVGGLGLFQHYGELLLTVGLWPNHRGQIRIPCPPGGRRARFAATCDQQSARLLVDGQVRASGRLDGPELSETPGLLFIGRPIGSPAGHSAFRGTLHRLRLSQGVRPDHELAPAGDWASDEHTLLQYDFRRPSGYEAPDRSGHGHHGKIVAGTWVDAHGAALAASDEEATPPAAAASRFVLDFDGAGSCVEVPGLTYDGSYPLTLEEWVAPARLPASDGKGVVLFGWDGILNCEIWPNEVPAGNAFSALPSGQHVTAAGNDRLTPQRWHHVALVWDGKCLRQYVDGAGGVAAEQAPLHRPADTPGRLSDHFTLGCRMHIGQALNRHRLDFFKGQMTEFRASKVARYDSDFRPRRRWEPDAQTLALYHFDEGAGMTLRDASGNGRDGTIVGAKWEKATVAPAP